MPAHSAADHVDQSRWRRLTGRPISSAAASLPPTAWTVWPKAVRLSTHQPIAKTHDGDPHRVADAEERAGAEDLEDLEARDLRDVVALVGDEEDEAADRRSGPASVTMNGGSRSRAMTRPCSSPTAAAATSGTRIAAADPYGDTMRAEDHRERVGRADRQVDAAADDHERHADRDDRDEGGGQGDVAEVVGRAEGRHERRCPRTITTTSADDGARCAETSEVSARPRASAAARPPRSAAVATTAASDRRGRPDSSRSAVIGCSSEPLDVDRGDDDQRLDDAGDRSRGTLCDDQRGLEQLDEHGAGDGAEDPDLAAGERGAADDHRGDGGELDAAARRRTGRWPGGGRWR